MKKQLLFIIIIASLLVLAISPGIVHAANPTGKIGDDVIWEYDEVNEMLILSGSGSIYDFVEGITDNEPDTIKARGFEAYIADMKGIYVSDGITYLGSGIFGMDNERFDKLATIRLPNSLAGIGDFAFYYDTELMDIMLPDSVVSIGRGAFYNCSNVASVYIGKGLELIGPDAFTYMNSLEYFTVDSKNPYYSEYDDALYNKDLTKLIQCPLTKSGKFILPDSVMVIGQNACDGCDKLTSVILPEQLKTIESSAFFYCKNVTEMVLPDSLEVIEKKGMAHMYSLENIIIPESVKEVGFDAFGNTSKQTLTFKGDAPKFVSSNEVYSISGYGNKLDLYFDCTKSGWSKDMFKDFKDTVTMIRSHTIIEDRLAPTCEEPGYDLNYKCKGCGQHFLDSDGKNPIADFDAWKNDRANMLNANGHAMSSWNIGRYPSCVEKGTKGRICSVCGKEELLEIPYEKHEIHKIAYKEATCTRDGVKEHWQCKACKQCFTDYEGTNCANEDDFIIPAKGHQYDGGKITKPATESENGSITSICRICGEQKVQVIPMTGHVHILNKVAGKKSTCTKKGNMEYWECKICGAFYGDSSANAQITKASTVLPLKSHNYDQGTVTRKATFGKKGVCTYHCKGCNKTKTKSIPAIKKCVIKNSSFVYSGAKKKPKFSVLDTNGNAISSSYYSITYISNAEVGKATATVRFSGRYSGTKKVKFKIFPKKAALERVKSEKNKLIVTATTNVFNKGGEKYQFAYRMKGAAKWKTKSVSQKSATIRNLKSGRKYEVKVRAFTKIGDSKYNGKWSSIWTTNKIK